MKYGIIINGIKKFEINTPNSHGTMRNYIVECMLNGEKVEIVKN